MHVQFSHGDPHYPHSTFIDLCIHIYIYIWIYIYICLTHIYIYIYKYSHTHIYIYTHIYVFSTSSFSRWFKTYSCSQWSSECVLHIVLSGRHGEDDRRRRSPGGELRIAGAASGATSAGGSWSSETRGYSTWPDLMAQNHGVKWLVLDDLEEPSILGHLHMCLSWSVWKGKPAKSTGHHDLFFYWTDFLGVDSRHTRIEAVNDVFDQSNWFDLLDLAQHLQWKKTLPKLADI